VLKIVISETEGEQERPEVRVVAAVDEKSDELTRESGWGSDGMEWSVWRV
jgi:hypothetical protein